MPRRSKRKTEEQHLWSRGIRSESGCLEFRGQPACRYPIFWYRGKPEKAHRVAYRIAKGEIPEGMKVCHSCDNTICIDPAHLFLGTQADNLADMVRKGRHGVAVKREAWEGRWFGGKQSQPGEKNPAAVLCESQVSELREMRRSTGMKYGDLAARFGISKSQAFRIVKKQSWR